MNAVLQPTAFHCWSSRKSTDPISSIVRGGNIKPDSAMQTATSGSATTCSVSWHIPAAISWGLTYRQTMTRGTTPSTARLLYSMIRPTTRCRCPGTRVTLAMRSLVRAVLSSPHMIAIMTRGTTVTTTGTTVQSWTAADVGSACAAPATSTTFVVVDTASGGGHSTCRPHACGWRARSLHTL